MVVNLFSLLDLLAVFVSTHVLLVFLHRSVRVTKRKVDLLFTAVMALVWLEGIFVLVSDNIVAAGTPSIAVPGAAAQTLLFYRLMYVAEIMLIPTLTHFALRYTQSAQLRGLRVGWLYAAALALVPLVFTDGFLAARETPLQVTSSWWWAVPWQPVSGPLTAVFAVAWVAANIYVQWLLWHRPRASRRTNEFDQRNFVAYGITLWGLAGLVSMILAAFGYAGVDPTMILFTIAMVMLAIGLAEDHLHSVVRNGYITEVFGRYVTADVVEKLLDAPDGLELGGEKRVVSVLMSDVRGFTAIAETLPPERVVELLNVYLGAMADVITAHHGTINEFIGDGILAIFGAPIRREDATESAVHCALAMQLAMPEVNAQLARLRIPPLEMGIGINTGEVVVGNIGSAKRAKYGVVGSNVNLAGRIESATVGGQVLVSRSTVEALAGRLEIRQEVLLRAKGAKDAFPVFDVVAINGHEPLHLPIREEQWHRLVPSAAVECTYVSDEKQVVGRSFDGRVVATSLTSAQLEASQRLEVGANVRMRMIATTSAGRRGEIYGKVIAVHASGGPCVVRFTSALAASTSGHPPELATIVELFRESAAQAPTVSANT